jgi:monothiol glutaredoxin
LHTKLFRGKRSQQSLTGFAMLENKNFAFIKNEIAENDVVLFMKGTKDSPLCGFSATVVMILRKMEVPFRDINVLTDMSLREDLKIFSDWPTIPQLYIKGEFIGGCDIVKEMYANNDLALLLKDKGVL